MEERLINILEAAVREFIKTGEPISSGLLYDHYDFGIRPARIRSELQTLTDKGYLEQPYHSAGRIPSDRGYQFFVERLLERNGFEHLRGEVFENLFRKSRWEDLLQNLSEHLGIAGVVDDYAHDEIYKGGLEVLMEYVNWDYPKEVKEVIKDFECLEERVEQARNVFEKMGEMQVFIGRKSPITRSNQLSVVAGEYRDQGKHVHILAVGPKWMNYPKVISVFKNLQLFE